MLCRIAMLMAAVALSQAGCGGSVQEGYWHKPGVSVTETRTAHEACRTFAGQTNTSARNAMSGTVEGAIGASIASVIDFNYCMKNQKGYKFFRYSAQEKEKFDVFESGFERGKYYYQLSASGGAAVR